MSNELTHWKKQFNYDYLGAYSLADGKDVTLTMQATKREMVVGGDGKKQECFICYFKEKADWIKPMILNRTNCKTIEKIYGTPYIEQWSGKQITIYIANGIKAFGDVVDALRIRPEKPKKIVVNNQHKHWASCCEFVKNGGAIEKILDKYTMDETTIELLKEFIQKKEDKVE